MKPRTARRQKLRLSPRRMRDYNEKAYALAFPKEKAPRQTVVINPLSGPSVTEYERDPETKEITRSVQVFDSGARIITDFVRDPETKEILRTERKVFR